MSDDCITIDSSDNDDVQKMDTKPPIKAVKLETHEVTKKRADLKPVVNGRSIFESFIEKFKENAGDSPDDTDRAVKKLWKGFNESDPPFTTSQLFQNMMNKAMKHVNKEPWSEIKHVYDELKYYSVKKKNSKASKARQPETSAVSEVDQNSRESQPGTSSATAAEPRENGPTLDPRTVAHIEKLTKTMAKINAKIAYLEKKEVDMNSSDEENSAYIQVSRYKERLCQIFNKIGELRSKSGVESSFKTIKFSGTKIPAVNRAIERFYNSRKAFPDFRDVLVVVQAVNDKKKLGLSAGEMQRTAEIAFRELGETLKLQRQYDFHEAIISYLPEDAIDPATESTELKQKLEENKRLYGNRIDEIIDKYATKQLEEHLEPAEVSSDAEASDNENDDDEEEAEADNVTSVSEYETEEEPVSNVVYNCNDVPSMFKCRVVLSDVKTSENWPLNRRSPSPDWATATAPTYNWDEPCCSKSLPVENPRSRKRSCSADDSDASESKRAKRERYNSSDDSDSRPEFSVVKELSDVEMCSPPKRIDLTEPAAGEQSPPSAAKTNFSHTQSNASDVSEIAKSTVPSNASQSGSETSKHTSPNVETSKSRSSANQSPGDSSEHSSSNTKTCESEASTKQSDCGTPKDHNSSLGLQTPKSASSEAKTPKSTTSNPKQSDCETPKSTSPTDIRTPGSISSGAETPESARSCGCGTPKNAFPNPTTRKSAADAKHSGSTTSSSSPGIKTPPSSTADRQRSIGETRTCCSPDAEARKSASADTKQSEEAISHSRTLEPKHTEHGIWERGSSDSIHDAVEDDDIEEIVIGLKDAEALVNENGDVLPDPVSYDGADRLTESTSKREQDAGGTKVDSDVPLENDDVSILTAAQSVTASTESDCNVSLFVNVSSMANDSQEALTDVDMTDEPEKANVDAKDRRLFDEDSDRVISVDCTSKDLAEKVPTDGKSSPTLNKTEEAAACTIDDEVMIIDEEEPPSTARTNTSSEEIIDVEKMDEAKKNVESEIIDVEKLVDKPSRPLISLPHVNITEFVRKMNFKTLNANKAAPQGLSNSNLSVVRRNQPAASGPFLNAHGNASGFKSGSGFATSSPKCQSNNIVPLRSTLQNAFSFGRGGAAGAAGGSTRLDMQRTLRPVFNNNWQQSPQRQQFAAATQKRTTQHTNEVKYVQQNQIITAKRTTTVVEESVMQMSTSQSTGRGGHPTTMQSNLHGMRNMTRNSRTVIQGMRSSSRQHMQQTHSLRRPKTARSICDDVITLD